IVAECNNALVFPGLGLGLVLSRASICTDGILAAATRALADLSPARKDPTAALLPPMREIRRISKHIAVAVLRQAFEEGVATVPREDVPFSRHGEKDGKEDEKEETKRLL